VRSTAVPGVAAAAVVLAVLSGCTANERRQVEPPQPASAIFAAACSACHTLTGRDSPAVGGDLAIDGLSVRAVASFVRVMPVHLSAAEIGAVANYVHLKAVSRSEGRSRTSHPRLG
jgi:mono/diheme cytochrome c family protein